MKVKENHSQPIGEKANVTPFEKAEQDAHIFATRAIFIQNFNLAVEEYVALNLVMEELKECKHENNEIAEIFEFSKSMLEKEKLELEKQLDHAAYAWAEQFGVEA